MKDIWHEPGEKPTRKCLIYFLYGNGIQGQIWQGANDSMFYSEFPWCYGVDLAAMLHELRAKAAANVQTDEDVRMWELGHKVACVECGFDGTMLSSDAACKSWWITCGTGICAETSKHKTQDKAWKEWIEMNQPKPVAKAEPSLTLDPELGKLRDAGMETNCVRCGHGKGEIKRPTGSRVYVQCNAIDCLNWTGMKDVEADAWREWIEMNQPKALPCRKCGNLPSTSTLAGKGYWLSCDTCQQAGPTFDTANEAIEEWNKRMDQPEKAAKPSEAKKPSVSDDFWAWHKGSMEARQKLRDWYDKRVPLTQRVKEALSNVPPVDSKSAGDDSKIIGVLQDINDALEAKAKEPQSALDRQVGGNHYKGFAIQPVEFCELNNLTTCESNAIKYLCRHRHPEGGKGLQDLQKAIDYIQKLIEMRYPEAKS